MLNCTGASAGGLEVTAHTTLRDTRRQESGATMIEMTLSIPVFLAMTMGLISLALVVINSIVMHFSLHHAARYASLGIRYPGMSREQSITHVLGASLGRYGLNIDGARIEICPTGVANCEVPNAGGPQDRVRFAVQVEMGTVFPTSSWLLERELTFQNEPF